MKIKIISTRPEGCGIGDYTRRLVNGLKETEYLETKIVYTKQDSLNPLFFMKLLRETVFGSDIVHIQFDYSFFGKNGIFIPIFFPLLWVVQRYKFRVKNNIIISIHEIRDLNVCKFKLYYWLLNQIIARCSDMIVVFSDKVKNDLLVQKIPKHKIRKISHGILLQEHILDKDYAKKQLGLKPSDNIVTIFGYVHNNKGHDLLINVIKDIDTKLLVAGSPRTEEDKPYYEFLKNRVREFGIEEKVKFLGYVSEDQIPIVLSATDIMVLPYRTIVESGILNIAMAYHLPTIVSNLPYFREIEKQYGCVFISKNLKEDIKYVHKYLQTTLRHKAEIYAKKESYEKTVKKMYKLYIEVGEADHPSIIYREKSQKERIDFLVKHTVGRTLEVGCSTGYVLNRVTSDGVGIDIRKDRLLYARLKYPHLDFKLASGDKLPFSDKSFDTVLLPDILEHVDYNFAKIIAKECIRVGKKVIITVPSPNSKWIENPEHMWIPTRELVSDLGKGINVIETKDFIYGVKEDETNTC